MPIDSTDNLSLADMDRQSVMHPLTNLQSHASGKTQPTIIRGGHGVYIVGDDGRQLIDGFSALYCVNAGYGRVEIANAIYEQAKKLAYFHTYRGHSNEPLIRLSHRVLAMAPDNMSKIYYGMSGSDANETQIKIVWYYNNVLNRPRKKKVISRIRGYHGSSIMAGSLTGLERFHKAFDLPIGPILHTTAPHYFWGADEGMSECQFSAKCASDLEALIQAEGPETIAAFIAEPVMGTGGIIPPPESYWEFVQEVLHKYDVLLIADEVVTGFGRIGANFGSQHYNIKPDLMTIAKGLTSAYLPLSGSIVSKRIWEVLENGSDVFGEFAHGYTYSGHPLAAAAALANLDIIDREGLIENARITGAYLRDRLHDTFDHHPMVGEVRGVGLLAAIEFVRDKKRKIGFDKGQRVGSSIVAECLRRGLIARGMPVGEVLGLAPPLTLTRQEVDKIVEIVQQAVRTVQDELTRNGIELS